MKCYQVDPILDPRWATFTERHPNASIFHSVGWLTALKQTYGFEPIAFTLSPPDREMDNGLPLCQIKSWLTGNRKVSLPFSDHCELLFDSEQDLDPLISSLLSNFEYKKWRYIELRPVNLNIDSLGSLAGFVSAGKYFLHVLDLSRDVTEIFRSLHKDSVQRRVRRAENAGLTERCGASDVLLKDFFRLMLITRRRHCIPPPPIAWYQNLIRCLGKALEIRVAYRQETPIAAILTLRFRDVVYYKYGCSDVRFNQFGAMPWLLWNAIAAAKLAQATRFDMGRTDADDAGLLAFKNHWALNPQLLTYWRFPKSAQNRHSRQSWKSKLARPAFSHMPLGLLKSTGKLLYRHFG